MLGETTFITLYIYIPIMVTYLKFLISNPVNPESLDLNTKKPLTSKAEL